MYILIIIKNIYINRALFVFHCIAYVLKLLFFNRKLCVAFSWLGNAYAHTTRNHEFYVLVVAEHLTKNTRQSLSGKIKHSNRF